MTNGRSLAAESDVAVELHVPLPGPCDLPATLGLHLRGRADPSMRIEASGAVWRATRTAAGPATILLEPAGVGTVRVRAWGPGAELALAAAPGLVGAHDDPSALTARHRVVEDAQRRRRGLRIGGSGSLFEALVPAILEQKITGDEARRTYRNIVRVFGEDAPGPPGLRVFPAAEVLADVPYHAFHPLGLERRRGELIRAIAREAPRLERLAADAIATDATAADRDQGQHAARARVYAALRAFPGIGPWTAAEVGLRVLGDPDAVSVGDFHVPSMVAWALAGEPRATDERMLELLEPYRGQRARVVRLLELAGIRPPRYGPRMPTRRIEAL